MTFKKIIGYLIILLFYSIFLDYANGANLIDKSNISGLALPRFASIKSAKMNARVGPGRKYPVIWMYQRPGLPVEIIKEYDHWRKIRDSNGDVSWVYQSLLSGKRTAIIAPWHSSKSQMIPLNAKPSENSRAISFVEPGSIAFIKQCTGVWCQLDFIEVRGWIHQERIWGVYPGEIIN